MPWKNIAQITLTLNDSLNDCLILKRADGRMDDIHAGDCFTALFPNGWHDIRLEADGDGVWYIAYPSEFRDVCPIGLFVKDE